MVKNLCTKTDFITYLDAPRHLWAASHGKINKEKLHIYVEHLIEQGYEVEALAVRYVKEILIPKYNIDLNSVRLQPTCTGAKYQARVDVLINNPQTNKWDIYEIKSATSITKLHKFDATFQTLVFQDEFEIGEIYLIHLNANYVRGDKLSLEELFTIRSITSDVELCMEKVRQLRENAWLVINGDNFSTLKECTQPKTCLCKEICHPTLPDYSIYDINRISSSKDKLEKLRSLGILDIHDVPPDFELTPIQKAQVTLAQKGGQFVDKEKIIAELQKLNFPLFFIDYEAFNPAVPLYRGYKPFDQMSFQWSLHILKNDRSETEHYEFLETEIVDPIPNFINELKQHLDDEGSIVVWNQSFEATVNRRIGEIHPEFKNFCLHMNKRMFDLMQIFKNQYYDDPKFKGSYSIKYILPALIPEVSYADLDVSEGASAMTKWKTLVYNKTTQLTPEDKQKLIASLLTYCKQDTFAMVKIYEYLRNTVSN